MSFDFNIFSRRPYKLAFKLVGRLFPSKIGCLHKGKHPMAAFQLPDDKGARFAITGLDKHGNPTKVDSSTATASSSDESIATAAIVSNPTPELQGSYLEIQAAGKLGPVQVTVKIGSVTGILDVEAIAGDTATLNISPAGSLFDLNTPPAP